MRFVLLDRENVAAPRRFATKAAAGAALLTIAVRHYVVKRKPLPSLVYESAGKRLIPFGLYVARDGHGLELVGSFYARNREVALKYLLAAAAGRSWPDTPAAMFHVVELTAAEQRHYSGAA